MRIEEALELFEIDNIDEVNMNKLGKVYKRLVKRHHPDVGGDPENFIKVKEAYGILRNFLVLYRDKHLLKKFKFFCDILEFYRERKLTTQQVRCYILGSGNDIFFKFRTKDVIKNKIYLSVEIEDLNSGVKFKRFFNYRLDSMYRIHLNKGRYRVYNFEVEESQVLDFGDFKIEIVFL